MTTTTPNVLQTAPTSSPRKSTLWLSLVIAMGLSGCVTTNQADVEVDATATATVVAAEPNQAPVIKASAQVKEDRAPRNMIAEDKLNSTQMLKVLTGEMYLSRQQNAKAFVVFYELAQELQDAELAHRAFRISMSTYDIELISQATGLWRELAPQDPLPWRASILLSLRSDNIEQAVTDFQKFESLSAEPLEQDFFSVVSRLAATISEGLGKQFMQAITAAYPEEWSAFYSQAQLALAHGRYQDAIAAFQKSVDLSPPEYRENSLNEMAELYIRLGQSQQGLDYIEPFIEEYPENTRMREAKARMLVQLERYDEAKSVYQEVIERDAEANSARLSLALIQVEFKEFDDAELNLSQLVKVEAYEVLANYYLGVVKQEQGDTDEALKYLNKVNQSNYQTDALLRRAEILFKRGDRVEAMQLLQAFKMGSNQDRVRVLRAQAIFSSMENKYEQSLDYYQQALALDPENIDLMISTSQILYELEKFADYEGVLQNLLKLEPNNSDALNALAYYYVEEGKNLELAQQMLERALELDPQSFYIMDSLGWLYYTIGDYAKAVPLIEQAFEQSQDEEVFVHLVKAYWHNDQQDKATELWNDLGSKFDSYEPAQDLLQRLKQGAK